MLTNDPIVTRFAPSPTGTSTGSLHLGGARTALFNWLYARQNNGKFILRIEDTDYSRSTQASAAGLIKALQFLGLDWDEGPYWQSKRLHIYREYFNLLREKNLIYPAFETPAELTAMRQQAMAEKRNPIYNGQALQLTKAEIQAKIDRKLPCVWRFKVSPTGFTKVPELLMQQDAQGINNNAIGDFVITRPGLYDEPGVPLYNFVCTIDDTLMGITHVIRGVEHLPNAVKQVLLYQALGYNPPQFVHLPLIFKDGKKMSKREQVILAEPVGVLERAELGFLPDACLNYIALLGWTDKSGAELFYKQELIEKFSLTRLSKSNANFDEKKFLFINSYHIKNLTEQQLLHQVMPFLLKSGLAVNLVSQEQLIQILNLEQERCKTLAEFPPAIAYFFQEDLHYEQAAQQKYWQHNEQAITIISATYEAINACDDFSWQNIEALLKTIMQEFQLPFNKYGPIIRLALTGREKSPSLAAVISILGKQKCIQRLLTATRILGSK